MNARDLNSCTSWVSPRYFDFGLEMVRLEGLLKMRNCEVDYQVYFSLSPSNLLTGLGGMIVWILKCRGTGGILLPAISSKKIIITLIRVCVSG